MSTTALISSCENERPSAAPICATSRVGARRSSRANSEAWSVVGMAKGATAPTIPNHRIPVVSRRHQSALDNGFGQFLDKQRHAVGTIDDLVCNLFGQRFATGNVGDH